MFNLVRSFFKDSIYNTGLFCLAVSVSLFLLTLDGRNNGVFMVHFGLTVLFFLIVLISGRLRAGRNGLHLMTLFLVLFLVSCYGLNREINVFESAVPWQCVLLVVSCINILLFSVFEEMPRWMKLLMSFILGVSALLFCYLTLYLIPLMPVGIIFFFALGLPLHALVPMLICIYLIVLVLRYLQKEVAFMRALGAGLVMAVLTTIVFTITWCLSVARINNLKSEYSTLPQNQPLWSLMAAELPHNVVVERVLKTGPVYVSKADGIDEFSFFGNIDGGARLGEYYQHDPLVVIASIFGGDSHLEDMDRIEILKAMYGARHDAEERLWQGKDLETRTVKTQAEVWPAQRLSYTELTLNVHNITNGRSWWWGTREEAIYTFTLPEGGVVTSLSLWINDREEKGILTTKEKADSAYKTIVGLESRDPSVVHWKEGNTVTVRVFPVMTDSSRQFKIGVTAPLEARNGKLLYKSVKMQGPASFGAKEDLRIRFDETPAEADLPLSFSREDEKTITHTGFYNDCWEIGFKEVPLKQSSFAFNGRQYHVLPYKPKRVPISFAAVCLDINSAWTEADFNDVYRLCGDKKMYICTDGVHIEQLTPQNRDKVFERLSSKQFSLFPFGKIENPENTLVVTKCNPYSPQLGDLKGFTLLTDLGAYFKAGHKVNLFNIGKTLSPYISSLKQYRAFNYEQGDIRYLGDCLSGQFVKNAENDDRIVIESAGMMIVKADSAEKSAGTDHLLRLFAFNHILQQSGTKLLDGPVTDTSLIAEAKEAYVVTPVSSLIVLETQADYDRFGIERSKNSLENAGLNGQGAVPEPHEWVLIILAVALLIWCKYRFSFSLTGKR